MPEVKGRVLSTLDGLGAERLQIEEGFDPVVQAVVSKWGSPDYIWVVSGDRLHLIYVELDHVVSVQRKWAAQSVTSARKGIQKNIANLIVLDQSRRDFGRRFAEERRRRASAVPTKTPTPTLPPTPTPTFRCVRTKNWKTGLKIQKDSWMLDTTFVATARWVVMVKNVSCATTFKDINFQTSYSAQSGTTVDRSFLGHTEFVALKPGEVVRVEWSELTHRQARTAQVWIKNAEAL